MSKCAILTRWVPIICLLQILSLHGQPQQAIGEWRSFLPHDRGQYATESPDYIFYVDNQSLTRFDKEDLSRKTITRIDGLSDIGVDLISYNYAVNALVIAYRNSNIDIVYENEIINIPDIQRSTQIVGDRQILSILQDGERTFLSTGFGIVVLDLEEGVIIQSVETPQPVTDFVRWKGDYIAFSEDRAFALNADNFGNFQFWSLWEDRTEELGIEEEISYAEVFEDILFTASMERLFALESPGASPESLLTLHPDDGRLNFIQSGYNYLMAGIENFSEPDVVHFYRPDLSFETSHGGCHGIVRHAIEADNGMIFYGDEWGGFRWSNGPAESCSYMFYPGPSSTRSTGLDYREGTLVIANGGPVNGFQYSFSRDGMSIFRDGEWKIVKPELQPELTDPDMREFFKVLIDPENPEIIYAGTYWGGVVEYRPDGISIYNKTNSCLQGAVGDELRERITGMAMDQNGDLWLSNYVAPQGLKVLRKDGSCEGWNTPTSSTLADLVIDDFGFIWTRVVAGDAGVLVFDPGRTEETGERFRTFTQGNSALPTNDVTCLEVDRSGNVWVGTTEGMVLFACGNQVFDLDCSKRPVVDENNDGVGDFLLSDVRVNTIETDGANRKWVGTDGGIIVLSGAGTEELFSFDKDNSPLFSNAIVNLAFDEEDGVMYIATSEGVMSYRTRSTGADIRSTEEMYAYPNPVRPEYEGPIAIKGLPEDALVKITDIEGRLVHETRALGGQAIWDGNQWNGERVSSGVYLVWISGKSESLSLSEPQTAVIKIAVIH